MFSSRHGAESPLPAYPRRVQGRARPPPGSRFPAPGLRQCPAHMGSLPAAKRTEAAQGKTAAQRNGTAPLPSGGTAGCKGTAQAPQARHKSHCMQAPRPLDSRQRSAAMRMWMLPPETMCRKHLLGEHVELHMLLGSLRRGKNIDGFLAGSWWTPGACSGGTRSLCSKWSGAATGTRRRWMRPSAKRWRGGTGARARG